MNVGASNTAQADIARKLVAIICPPRGWMPKLSLFYGPCSHLTHQGIHVSFYEKDALSVNVRDPIDEALYDVQSGYSGPILGTVCQGWNGR